MIHKAFILGAGLGLRLRPLTEHRPKPTLPVFGRPVIEYVIQHLKSVGVEEVVINTHHCPQSYRDLLGYGEALGLKIHYSYEEKLLDTGGGLKNVESFFKEEGPFIVYNGDILTNGDLAGAVQFHRIQKALATLILSPEGHNRNVSLGEDGVVTDLRGVLGDKVHTKYQFCGIQILEREIFEHIPQGKAISLVDIYLELIRQGRLLRGRVWRDCFWKDIGDLESYAGLHEELLDAKAGPFFGIHPLGQDGSDRIYYRVGYGKGSPPQAEKVLMRYGNEKKENAFYHRIAIFLKNLGLSVPAVYEAPLGKGLLLVEDLGNVTLCHAFAGFPPDRVTGFYREVIRAIAQLHLSGADFYQSHSFPICPPFTEKTYLWESRYFEENLLGEFLGIKLSGALKEDFDRDALFLARRLAREKRVLIHRDLQSKNVMIKESRPYLIDFQGMRFGLAPYDLAALLYDPYVAIEALEREGLYQEYLEQAGKRLFPDGENRFRRIYQYCAVQRLMQALGAYAFLGLKKGKSHFLKYIPVALDRLQGALENTGGLEGMKKLVHEIRPSMV